MTPAFADMHTHIRTHTRMYSMYAYIKRRHIVRLWLIVIDYQQFLTHTNRQNASMGCTHPR